MTKACVCARVGGRWHRSGPLVLCKRCDGYLAQGAARDYVYPLADDYDRARDLEEQLAAFESIASHTPRDVADASRLLAAHDTINRVIGELARLINAINARANEEHFAGYPLLVEAARVHYPLLVEAARVVGESVTALGIARGVVAAASHARVRHNSRLWLEQHRQNGTAPSLDEVSRCIV